MFALLMCALHTPSNVLLIVFTVNYEYFVSKNFIFALNNFG